jgi:hypothetical protein
VSGSTVAAAIMRARKADLKTVSPRALDLFLLILGSHQRGRRPPSFADLRAKTGLSPNGVTRLLKQLFAAGLVGRGEACRSGRPTARTLVPVYRRVDWEPTQGGADGSGLNCETQPSEANP